MHRSYSDYCEFQCELILKKKTISPRTLALLITLELKYPNPWFALPRGEILCMRRKDNKPILIIHPRKQVGHSKGSRLSQFKKKTKKTKKIHLHPQEMAERFVEPRKEENPEIYEREEFTGCRATTSSSSNPHTTRLQGLTQDPQKNSHQVIRSS